MVRLAFEKYSSATNRGLRRVGDVYAEFLEADFHAAIEFPLHRPTARIGAFDLTDDRHHRPVDLIDSPKIEVAAHQRFKLQLTTHFGGDLLEHLASPVDIFVVRLTEIAAFPMPRLVLVTLVTELKGIM